MQCSRHRLDCRSPKALGLSCASAHTHTHIGGQKLARGVRACAPCERTGELIYADSFAPNGARTEADRAEDEVPLGQVPSVERPVAVVQLNEFRIECHNVAMELKEQR
jgi:hypothetical protein